MFELEHNISRGTKLEALLRDRGSCDITTRFFKLTFFPRCAIDLRVERKPGNYRAERAFEFGLEVPQFSETSGTQAPNSLAFTFPHGNSRLDRGGLKFWKEFLLGHVLVGDSEVDFILEVAPFFQQTDYPFGERHDQGLDLDISGRIDPPVTGALMGFVESSF